MVANDFALTQICGLKSADEQTRLQNRYGFRLENLNTAVCAPEPRILHDRSRGTRVARSRYLG